MLLTLDAFEGRGPGNDVEYGDPVREMPRAPLEGLSTRAQANCLARYRGAGVRVESAGGRDPQVQGCLRKLVLIDKIAVARTRERAVDHHVEAQTRTPVPSPDRTRHLDSQPPTSVPSPDRTRHLDSQPPTSVPSPDRTRHLDSQPPTSVR